MVEVPKGGLDWFSKGLSEPSHCFRAIHLVES